MKLEKVSICGMECEFNDIRIECSSVPEGKYQFEVAGLITVGMSRLGFSKGYWSISLVHVCNKPLPIGENGVLWLANGDFVWQ